MAGKYQNQQPRRHKRLLGPALLAVGAVLLIVTITLIIRGIVVKNRTAQYTQEALAAMETIVLETVPQTAAPAVETTVPETTASTEPTDPTDPITLSSEFVDGHEYVGYLEFPSLERKLPVMKIKYLEDLQIAPCLEKGSPHTDDAVICAHNYPAHFGPIRDWTGGEVVVFTDLEENTICYTVAKVEKISPYDVEKVMESEHDLVLYTCTPGGANRVMIACDRTE